jgi:hypothetical protein
MSGDESMWVPVKAADVADESPTMLSGHLRALQRDVHDGFDRIGRALEGLTRIEARIDVLIDRQNHIEARQDALERRVSALETKRTKRK